MPRVSVIIPAFNSGRFIGQTLASVFAQTYSDYEVIVADDGSTDDTHEIVGRYGKRITHVRQANRGPAAARNLAISRAVGEFIAYLDADDVWYSHKLERQVAFLDANKACGIVHSDFTVIDETDRVIHRRFNQETRAEIPPPQGHCELDLLRRCHIQIPTVVERYDCFRKIGGFDERLKGVEDYARWISLAMKGISFGYIEEPLAMYRRTPGSLSSSMRRNLEGFLRIFEILVREKSLAHRGEEAMDIVRHRTYALRRELAYLNRIEGYPNEARKHLLGLIWGSPLRTELYMDLLKSAVPAAIHAQLRSLRGRARPKEESPPSS
jgi:glycosyltransferase involved in cell wall biosynthesis